MSNSSDISLLIEAAGSGSAEAVDRLLEAVYHELRVMANAMTARESPDQSIQATDLVHEAYLRLFGGASGPWDGRAHFFGAAAEAMRRILIEQARRKATARRGGGRRREPLGEVEIAVREDTTDLLALDLALDRLEGEDPIKATLVKLRYFTGMTIPQAADALGISRATVPLKFKGAFTLAGNRSAIDIDLDTILDDLEALFEGGFEITNDTWSVLFWTLYVELETDIKTRTLLGESDTDLDAKIWFVDAALARRLGAWPLGDSATARWSLDAIGGVRYMYIDIEVSEDGPFRLDPSGEESDDWLDPFVGGEHCSTSPRRSTWRCGATSAASGSAPLPIWRGSSRRWASSGFPEGPPGRRLPLHGRGLEQRQRQRQDGVRLLPARPDRGPAHRVLTACWEPPSSRTRQGDDVR